MMGADPSDIADVRAKWLDVIRRYRDEALKALDEEEEIAKKDNEVHRAAIEHYDVIQKELKVFFKEVH